MRNCRRGRAESSAARCSPRTICASSTPLAISSANRNRWRAVGFAVLVAMSMFIANVLGQLWDAVAPLRPASMFYYYTPQRIWLKNDWLANLGEAWTGASSVPILLVLISVGAIGYLVALHIFTRRDLPAPL